MRLGAGVMTIDERLERLAVRHQALSESLELLTGSVHEQSANIDKFVAERRWSEARLDASMERLDALMERLDGHLSTVLDMVTTLATARQPVR
jgi:ABC-type transporter Mla subunit MlaD